MAFFQLPSKYENKVPYGRDAFLQFANLSDGERAILEDVLIDFQVEYVVTCKNEAQIVLANAEIGDHDPDMLVKVSNALLACLPFDILLLLRSHGKGKIYTAVKTAQKRNEGRANIISKKTLHTFVLGENSYITNNFLLNLQNTPFSKMTASDVISSWAHQIHAANKLHRQDLYARNRMSLTGFDFFIDVERYPREYYILKRKMVNEFCAQIYYVWSNYLEQTENTAIVFSSWLRAYLETCNEYLSEETHLGLTEGDVNRIMESFREHGSVDDDADPSLSIINTPDFITQMYTSYQFLWEMSKENGENVPL